MIVYDESSLLRRLSGLSAPRRVAFAAAAAQRLFPAYSAFVDEGGAGDPTALIRVLNRLWDDAEGDRMTSDEVRDARIACEDLSPPPDDEGLWTSARAYAGDAVAATTYALRALESGAPQEAAWAARSAYEAMDYYVSNDLGAGDDARNHPIVQAELARQEKDLEDLATSPDEASVIRQIRERAKANAHSLVGR